MNDAQYKAGIFLTGVFLKIGVTDEVIKRKVTDIFLPVIVEIMKSIPYNKRVSAFSPLLECVSYFIGYQEEVRKMPRLSGQKEFIALDKFITNTYKGFAKGMLEILRINDNRSRTTAKTIINSVFIDEVACDLGEKILEYRKATSEETKTNLKNAIELLLIDYNEVSGMPPLTFQDIISGKLGETNGSKRKRD